jgi:hypothetical protein
MYQLLLEYQREHHNLEVPMGRSARPYRGKNLAQWINSQRTRYRNGKMSESRANLLQQIPGWHWSSYKNAWTESYRQVLALSKAGSLKHVFAAETAANSRIKAWITTQRRKYFAGQLQSDAITLLEEIPGWTWAPRDEKWEQARDLILQFVDREGHIRVPRSHIEDGFKIGELVHGYRQRINKGTAEPERAKFLQSLPGWQQDPFEEAWERNYESLARLAENHGHSQPTRSMDPSLDAFVQRQRLLRRKGKLSESKIARLSQLPGWSWDPKSEQWESSFSIMSRFAKETGGRRPKDDEVFDGFDLGTWVGVQRRTFKSGKMSSDRKRRLEAIRGWSWSPIDDDWNSSYELLKTHAKRYGHCRVGKSTKSARELEMWIGVQRSTYRSGKLSADRKEQLESLAGWSWSPVADLWQANYQGLCRFVSEHRRLPVKNIRRERELRSWISIQRTRYKRKTIPAVQTRLLETVPGWSWDPFTDLWQTSFAALRDFVRREGHAMVPSKHFEKGVNLGSWVNGVRTKHHRGQLSADRVKELEDLPGWTWNQRDTQWEMNFELLRRYAAKHGSAAVLDNLVYEGVAIGKWVGKQRAKKSRRTLDASRQKRLESLPGWLWNASHMKAGRTKSVP